MKNYRIGFGLSSLLLFIPAPTLIYQYFKALAESGSIHILDIDLYGFQAQLTLVTMFIISVSLFIVSLRELGRYFQSN